MTDSGCGLILCWIDGHMIRSGCHQVISWWLWRCHVTLYVCLRFLCGPPTPSDLHWPAPHLESTLQPLGEGVPHRGGVRHHGSSDPPGARQRCLQGPSGWAPRTQVSSWPPSVHLTCHRAPASHGSPISVFYSGWQTTQLALATARSVFWWRTPASQNQLSWRSTPSTYTVRVDPACPCLETMWRAASCR